MMRRLVVAVQAACADALALLLPLSCAGCDEPDVALCERCRLALAPSPRRRVVEAAGGEVVVWSGLAFDGVSARVLRALKEDGRTGLARAFVPAFAAALACAAPASAALVPLPTSRAAYRRRGFRMPDLVVRRAGHRVHPLLHHVRRTADQRGLDREARRQNVSGSLTAGAEGALAGLRVVVVDDVVTTGATLAEAVAALRAAGADVVAAVTVAATPRRHSDHGERNADGWRTHT